jgi:uncharacterized membrane protein
VRVQLGLVVAPLLDARTAERLREEVGGALAQRYPDVGWDVELVHEELIEPPARLTELVDATRARLLDGGWDAAVHVTDLPLRLGRRPLVSHASPTHGVALVSLPAVGVLQRERRLRDAVAGAVGALLGEGSRGSRRLTELAAEVEGRGEGVAFLTRVVTGNVRLLLGMIAANRPWRMLAHLDRALLGALAAAVFALVSQDVWRIAASLDAPRLTALMLISLAAAVASLIVAHGLWERAPDRRSREQVTLFNLATLATVSLGIACLYATVLVASLVGAALVIDDALLSRTVGHDVDVADYLRLAWLTSTLATAGGALGATLETDEAVREAAYAHRSR